MKRIALLLVIALPIVLTSCALDDVISPMVNKIPEAVIDASSQQGSAPLQVQLSAHYSHDDGTIVSYYWDFGDPQDPTPGTGMTASHNYVHPGTYLVKLTVTDDEGKLNYEKIVITVTNPAPVASFSMDNDAPVTGDEVSFTAAGSYDSNGTIVSYDWNFGDGSTGTGVETTHTYNDIGYYIAILTTTDNDGATTVVRHAVDVHEDTGSCGSGGCGGPDIPLAVITGLPSCSGGETGVAVEFDGSASRAADGVIVSYRWEFGDGQTGTGVRINHVYQQSGRYVVTLTVRDDAGTKGTAYGALDINTSSCGLPTL
ncbi:MAG: PKD domain-containing protein [Candidatus Bipolaricaulota bacterium]|nr:PKD domain-containing protein [Candidatus Bipolaricaulota bacterium]